MSHPMRVRGLKLFFELSIQVIYWVAPHAGAWIETWGHRIYEWELLVAPHAGAWIETPLREYEIRVNSESHPMRVRGLKL